MIFILNDRPIISKDQIYQKKYSFGEKSSAHQAAKKAEMMSGHLNHTLEMLMICLNNSAIVFLLMFST